MIPLSIVYFSPFNSKQQSVSGIQKIVHHYRIFKGTVPMIWSIRFSVRPNQLGTQT
jgi:hypothetical protein